MPSRYSSEGTRDDAREVSENLGVDFREIPIEAVVGAFTEALAPSFAGREPDLTEENLQARARGTLLMALSNKFGWLVVSTGNKSELAVGYATLYGDMVGGFALLKDVFKTDVFRLARHLNERAGRELIPVSTIERPPTRGAARRPARRPVAAAVRPARPRAGGLRRARPLARGAPGRVRRGDGRARARARRPRRVQAATGPARREAAPACVRARLAAPDREALAGLTASGARWSARPRIGAARLRAASIHDARPQRLPWIFALTRRRRSAPAAGRRAGALRRARAGGAGAKAASARSSSSSVHQRSSNTYSAFSCAHESVGPGVNDGVRTRWYCSCWPSHFPPMNGIDVQTSPHRRPDLEPTSPVSSSSSRRIASSGVSPRSMPPPGVAQTVLAGNSKRTSRMRSSGSITTARAAGRIRSSLTRDVARERPSQRARNHRSRSSHGTAAFAGDVDGSTNNDVCRASAPEGRAPAAPGTAPRYASLPTNPIDARPQLMRDRLQPLGAAREVALAQVARARGRAVGGVRDADPEREQRRTAPSARRAAA